MLGSVIYFEGGRSTEVGKELEGATVTEIVSPWALKIRHKGKDYDVALGQKPVDTIFRPITTATPPSGVTVAPAPASGGANPAPAAPAGGGTPTLTASPAVPAGAGIPAPAPVSQDAVGRMDAGAARTALAAVSAARERSDLDAATMQRLQTEEEWLVKRLEALNR